MGSKDKYHPETSKEIRENKWTVEIEQFKVDSP